MKLDESSLSKDMPDVAVVSVAEGDTALDWVGMNAIHLPTQVKDSLSSAPRAVNTTIQAYVNLRTDARGIHMSRLYLMLGEMFEENALSVSNLNQLLDNFLSTHEGLSTRAFVEFAFDFPIKRAALKSEFAGWKNYPVKLQATKNEGGFAVELAVDVFYSSTCPASAALSRQLISDTFKQRFEEQGTVTVEDAVAWLSTEQGISATPHSQRSVAEVRVQLDINTVDALPITALINAVEDTLQTPVQTAVKREDEQEFARLNAANLMFCEDSARKLKKMLNAEAAYRDFWLRVNHLESLHAHDAVAIVTKNVPGGYLPLP